MEWLDACDGYDQHKSAYKCWCSKTSREKCESRFLTPSASRTQHTQRSISMHVHIAYRYSLHLASFRFNKNVKYDLLFTTSAVEMALTARKVKRPCSRFLILLLYMWNATQQMGEGTAGKRELRNVYTSSIQFFRCALNREQCAQDCGYQRQKIFGLISPNN